ncbi:MAG: SRPBCC family protein [Acidiferrobacterales bacterium]
MRTFAACLQSLVLVVTLLAPTQVPAVEVRNVQVTQKQRGFIVSFNILLFMEPVWARKILTDYTQWPDLIDPLRETRVLDYLPDGGQRIWLSFEACVLLFCKTIRQVKDVEQRANGDILVDFVGEGSDFESGWERWRIRGEFNHTRVFYKAQFVPSFRTPPFIGAKVLKRELRQILITTGARLEALSIP